MMDGLVKSSLFLVVLISSFLRADLKSIEIPLFSEISGKTYPLELKVILPFHSINSNGLNDSIISRTLEAIKNKDCNFFNNETDLSEGAVKIDDCKKFSDFIHSLYYPQDSNLTVFGYIPQENIRDYLVFQFSKNPTIFILRFVKNKDKWKLKISHNNSLLKAIQKSIDPFKFNSYIKDINVDRFSLKNNSTKVTVQDFLQEISASDQNPIGVEVKEYKDFKKFDDIYLLQDINKIYNIGQLFLINSKYGWFYFDRSLKKYYATDLNNEIVKIVTESQITSLK